VEIRIPSISSENADDLMLAMQIAGRKYEFLVDSGASISVIKPYLVSGRTEQVDYTVRGVTGEKLDVLGSKEIRFQLGRSSYRHRFIVAQVSTPCDGIIGIDLLIALGAVIDLRTNLLRVGEEKFTLAGAGPCVASCAIHGEPEEVRGPRVGHPKVQVTRSEGGTSVLGHQIANEPTPSHKEGRSLEHRQLLSKGREAPVSSVTVTRAKIVTENREKVLKSEILEKELVEPAEVGIRGVCEAQTVSEVCGDLELGNSAENKGIRVVTGSNRGKTQEEFEVVNEVVKGDNHNEALKVEQITLGEVSCREGGMRGQQKLSKVTTELSEDHVKPIPRITNGHIVEEINKEISGRSQNFEKRVLSKLEESVRRKPRPMRVESEIKNVLEVVREVPEEVKEEPQTKFSRDRPLREHRPTKIEESVGGLTGCVASGENHVGVLIETRTGKERAQNRVRNRKKTYCDVSEGPYYMVTTLADSIYIIKDPEGVLWEIKLQAVEKWQAASEPLRQRRVETEERSEKGNADQDEDIDSGLESDDILFGGYGGFEDMRELSTKPQENISDERYELRPRKEINYKV
jgi:hypothetical protein